MITHKDLSIKEAHILAVKENTCVVMDRGTMTPTGRFIQAGMDAKVTIHPKYLSLLTSNTRYSLIQGGRASGKSFMTALYTLLLTYEKGQKILYTRYTMTSAADSIIAEFKGKIEDLGLEEDFDVQKDRVLNVKTGVEVLFKGMKTSSGFQTAALKSLTDITTYIVDEAEEVHDFEEFNKVNRSVRSQNAHNRVILILNAGVRTHWIYQQYFREADVADDFNGTNTFTNCTYVHTTYKDIEHLLDADYVKEINKMELHNTDRWREEFYGAWRNLNRGVIYENWTEGAYVVHGKQVLGLDFGFSNDETAALLVNCKVNPEGRNQLFVKEVLYEKELQPEDMYAKLHQNKNLVWTCDSARPEHIAKLKRLGANKTRGGKKPKIVDSIMLVKDFDLVIEGENLKWELENYCWKNKDIGLDEPIDRANHLLDALRYAVNYLWQRKGEYAVHASDDKLADKYLKRTITGDIWEGSGYAIG